MDLGTDISSEIHEFPRAVDHGRLNMCRSSYREVKDYFWMWFIYVSYVTWWGIQHPFKIFLRTGKNCLSLL
jgi:hypothetical protein